MQTKFWLLIIFFAVLGSFGLGVWFNKAQIGSTQPPGTNTAQPKAPTTFVCVQEGGQWKTFAEGESPNSNAVTRSKNPLFTWNSKEFGDNWTPEKRCREVTQRLTIAVANNGGKLANLDLKTGKVNDETVACAVKSKSEICNDQNILFTMSQHNEANPQQTLAKLINFSQQGIAIDETYPPSSISLASLVNLGAIEHQQQW